MHKVKRSVRYDIPFLVAIGFHLVLSILLLSSIGSTLFPTYFLYIVLGIVAFFFFANLEFEVISIFSKQLYVVSIVLLILPLLIGQVTRGAIRWIPIGALTIQPAEIVRPFLLIFFAKYLTEKTLTPKRLTRGILLLLLPLFLIFIQPSLGVTVLTLVGFVGILIASGLEKKYYIIGVLIAAVLLPVSWGLMADYQRARIVSFINPAADPKGAGYNSIQSVISIGSGKFLGRGLGKGAQTQLAFLPEKHSDFIFAATAEELGFIGALFLLSLSFFILFRLVKFLENSKTVASRAFVSGFFVMYLVQVMVHVGMNLGLLPITGLPFPLVSAGGSSLLATMAGLGIVLSSKR